MEQNSDMWFHAFPKGIGAKWAYKVLKIVLFVDNI